MRRHADIYFILYLTALVLLLATTKGTSPPHATTPPGEFPFRIKAEKPLLVCKIVTDSSGQTLLLADSINYISDYGAAADVEYNFVVEDTDRGEQLDLSSAYNAFSFKYDSVNRTAVFRWRPAPADGGATEKTYNVYATATATNPMHSSRRMQAQTQFAMVVVDERFAGSTGSVASTGSGETSLGGEFLPHYSAADNENIGTLPAEFSIKPQVQTLRGAAGMEWENTLLCYSFSPSNHSASPPNVEITNIPREGGGTAYVSSISDNSITLKGKMPEVGRANVSVSVKRKGDLKGQKVFFSLQPLAIPSADVPKTMFPGIEYSFNSALPADLPGAAAYIKEQNNVRYRTYSNTTIKFTPEGTDIGKTLSFERWLNGDLIGQRHYIKVIDFPPPEITELSAAGRNRLIIKTLTQGMHGNMVNTIKELRLVGNAKYVALYGKMHKNRAKMQALEQFQIEPADAGEPFIFEVVAVDQRGRVSAAKSYK